MAKEGAPSDDEDDPMQEVSDLTSLTTQEPTQSPPADRTSPSKQRAGSTTPPQTTKGIDRPFILSTDAGIFNVPFYDANMVIARYITLPHPAAAYRRVLYCDTLEINNMLMRDEIDSDLRQCLLEQLTGRCAGLGAGDHDWLFEDGAALRAHHSRLPPEETLRWPREDLRVREAILEVDRVVEREVLPERDLRALEIRINVNLMHIASLLDIFGVERSESSGGGGNERNGPPLPGSMSQPGYAKGRRSTGRKSDEPMTKRTNFPPL